MASHIATPVWCFGPSQSSEEAFWGHAAQKKSKEVLMHSLASCRRSSEGASRSPDLRLLIDSTPGLIHSSLPDGYLDFFNQTWLEYVGRPLEDLQGWKWTECIHPDDVEGILHKWRASLASGEPFLHEARVRRADGEYRWMLHHKTAVRDEHGEIVKWYGSSIDIEDRKRAEEELRKSAQELQRSKAYLTEAQRLSHTGSFEWKPESGEIVWSEETYRIFEYDHAVKPTLELVVQRVHPEDRADFLNVINRISGGAKHFEHAYRLLLPDGRVKHVHVLAHLLQNVSGNRDFVGAGIDTTTRTNAEEKLREREVELRHVLDLTPQLVAVFGPGGERLYANRILLDYLGLSLEEWRQRSDNVEFVHPDDRARVGALSDRALSSGNAYESEFRVRRVDGSYRWFLTRYNPLHDEQEKTTRWYVAAADIEEQKQAEERLRNENIALREEISKTSMFEEIVGSSLALKTVLSRIS